MRGCCADFGALQSAQRLRRGECRAAAVPSRRAWPSCCRVLVVQKQCRKLSESPQCSCRPPRARMSACGKVFHGSRVARRFGACVLHCSLFAP
eukprot:1229694-Lingulodinium_polyedra.AAC.1